MSVDARFAGKRHFNCEMYVLTFFCILHFIYHMNFLWLILILNLSGDCIFVTKNKYGIESFTEKLILLFKPPKTF